MYMKKTISVFGCFLFALVVFLPLGTLLSSCFGYQVELASVSVFSIVTAALSAFLAVLSSKPGESIQGGMVKVLFALLAPISLIHAVFCMLECSKIWVVTSVFICAGCCLFLTIKHGKPLALKMIALVLSALMVLPIGFFGFFALIFGNIGQNTVVKSVASPNGGYYAQVIDSDQGALGGDTLVNVYETKEIHALVFKLFKKPQTVYYGEWGEFETMQIEWTDENCLVINSVEYEIK